LLLTFDVVSEQPHSIQTHRPSCAVLHDEGGGKFHDQIKFFDFPFSLEIVADSKCLLWVAPIWAALRVTLPVAMAEVPSLSTLLSEKDPPLSALMRIPKKAVRPHTGGLLFTLHLPKPSAIYQYLLLR
jgi:hypothetical protein